MHVKPWKTCSVWCQLGCKWLTGRMFIIGLFGIISQENAGLASSLPKHWDYVLP